MAKETKKVTTSKKVAPKKNNTKTVSKKNEKMSETNIGISLITLILCVTILFLVGYIIYHM